MIILAASTMAIGVALLMRSARSARDLLAHYAAAVLVGVMIWRHLIRPAEDLVIIVEDRR